MFRQQHQNCIRNDQPQSETTGKKGPAKFIVNLDDRLDAALKKILSIEFHWFQQQLPGAISDRDPEFVHQARVATRRMRSALILFHNSLPEPTAIILRRSVEMARRAVR